MAKKEKMCKAGRSITVVGDLSIDPCGSARRSSLTYLNRTKPDPTGLGCGSGSGLFGRVGGERAESGTDF